MIGVQAVIDSPDYDPPLTGLAHGDTISKTDVKIQQRFSVSGTCFDVSNIIISRNEYNTHYVCEVNISSFLKH